MGNKTDHWTEDLFGKHPELFFSAFEERTARAPQEIDALLSHLEEQGYRPKRILDLNCGIGRHTIELGKRNIQVTGTDLSAEYIKIARLKAKEAGVKDKVSFAVADMRHIASKLDSEKPFDGIICLWTSFGFYDDKTNENILKSCLKLVRPGGFFALDIVNRDWLLHNYVDNRFNHSPRGILLQEGRYNPHNSRNYDTWTFLKQTAENTYEVERKIEVELRVWSLHELICLFENAGWKFKAAYPGLSAIGFTSLGQVSPPQPDNVLKSPMQLIIAYRP